MFSEFTSAENQHRTLGISIQSQIETNVERFEFDDYTIGTTQQAPESKIKKPRRKRKKKKSSNRGKENKNFQKNEKNENFENFFIEKTENTCDGQSKFSSSIKNVESFKDAFKNMMVNIRRMKEPKSFMKEGTVGESNGAKYVMVDGVKIFYNNSSLSDIINLNLRKKMF